MFWGSKQADAAAHAKETAALEQRLHSLDAALAACEHMSHMTVLVSVYMMAPNVAVNFDLTARLVYDSGVSPSSRTEHGSRAENIICKRYQSASGCGVSSDK